MECGTPQEILPVEVSSTKFSILSIDYISINSSLVLGGSSVNIDTSPSRCNKLMVLFIYKTMHVPFKFL